MVRPRWKSITCETCRKRKVKCNGALPTCETCEKSGRQCVAVRTEGSMIYGPGLSRSSDGNLGLQVRPPVSSIHPGVNLSSNELFRIFMTDYLPKQENVTVDDVTSLSWFESIQSRPERGPLLHMALESLSLSFVARKLGNIDLEEKGRHYASRVASNIQGIPENKASLIDVLGATSALAIYELYNCQPGQVDSWMVHTQAAWKLLEEKGPEVCIERNLLCRIRTVALYDACGRRKSTFLANPEWRCRAPRGGPFENLLDVMLDVPFIQEFSDKIIYRNYNPHQLQHLGYKFLDHFIETETRLQQCYMGFLSKQDGCPFSNCQVNNMELGILRDSPDLASLFQKAIQLPDRYALQFLLMAWSGFLIIYEEMSKVMRKVHLTIERNDAPLPRGSHGRPRAWLMNEHNLVSQQWSGNDHSPRTYRDFEKAAHLLANRICESVALCDKGTHGIAMRQPLLPALWAAAQFFKDRSLLRYQWCQAVLKNFAQKGLIYASGLAWHSYDGYNKVSNSLNNLTQAYNLREESLSPMEL